MMIPPVAVGSLESKNSGRGQPSGSLKVELYWHMSKLQNHLRIEPDALGLSDWHLFFPRRKSNPTIRADFKVLDKINQL